MSLELMFDSRTAEQFMYPSPDPPQLLKLSADGRALSRVISANTILGSGCFPPTDVNVVENDTGRHPCLFTSADRLDPVKLRQWRDCVPEK